MKKLYKLCLLALALSGMSACDKGEGEEECSSCSGYHIVYYYHVNLADQTKLSGPASLYFDYSITYYDENGDLQTDTQVTLPWEKHLTAKTKPEVIGVTRIKVTAKSNLPELGPYDLVAIHRYHQRYIYTGTGVEDADYFDGDRERRHFGTNSGGNKEALLGWLDSDFQFTLNPK